MDEIHSSPSFYLLNIYLGSHSKKVLDNGGYGTFQRTFLLAKKYVFFGL